MPLLVPPPVVAVEAAVIAAASTAAVTATMQPSPPAPLPAAARGSAAAAAAAAAMRVEGRDHSCGDSRGELGVTPSPPASARTSAAAIASAAAHRALGGVMSAKKVGGLRHAQQRAGVAALAPRAAMPRWLSRALRRHRRGDGVHAERKLRARAMVALDGAGSGGGRQPRGGCTAPRPAAAGVGRRAGAGGRRARKMVRPAGRSRSSSTTGSRSRRPQTCNGDTAPRLRALPQAAGGGKQKGAKQ